MFKNGDVINKKITDFILNWNAHIAIAISKAKKNFIPLDY